MFEAYLKITEKDMAWSELKALCEDRKLRVLFLALIDSEGRMVSDSSIAIPPDAQCALHFKTAETDMASGAMELVSESVGYIDAESREITKKWDCKSNAATPKVLMSAENLVHGIKSGGI